ncbi:hemolysin III family protein [Luteimonas sp. 8-5]|uniref:PAQR family membrane homeostasis protein TrhA n=1 Tax=Luteimonas sp. 8-5 TaxID=3039387 RepID=UPI002437415D|nr:hemolysin III family protein [Luteimonas sp. 8-5]MDG6348658.1 hemolysin III family protein [Luteimonas sp. 8-5]
MSTIPERTLPVRTSRVPTRGEDLANTLSHGIGLLLAICALPFLVFDALQADSSLAVVGATIFGGTAILMYLTSTLYHANPQADRNGWLRRLDHSAIYLLIAGTYTPVLLGVLRGSLGWTMLAVIWTLALAGIVFKLLAGARYRKVSVALYVGMGWAALALIQPLWTHMPPGGLAWLFAGGLAYTTGVAFYLLHDRMRYAHFIWHLFVLAGTGCHMVMVMGYA